MQIQNTASSRTAAAAANMIALQSERVHVTAEWYLLNHLHTLALAVLIVAPLAHTLVSMHLSSVNWCA